MYFSIPCRKRDTDQPEAVVWRFLVSVYALIKYEVHMRFVLGCFLALTLLKTTSAQEPVGELGAVLSLAAQYVAKYEGEQLGNPLHIAFGADGNRGTPSGRGKFKIGRIRGSQIRNCKISNWTCLPRSSGELWEFERSIQRWHAVFVGQEIRRSLGTEG